MKEYFYIHGVPQGQELWGPNEESDYVKGFYTGNQTESVKFVVEVNPKKNMSFYTYLRGKNVLGAGNRPGSYFAITLCCLDVYITETSNLYALFEHIYQNYILGKIIIKQGDSEKYKVNSFSEKENDLNIAKEKFLSFLHSRLSNAFEKIDGNFSKDTVIRTIDCNLDDVDCEAFYKQLKKHLKINVSKEYPSKDYKITHFDEELKPIREKNKQLSTQLTSKQEECESLHKKYEQVFKDKSKLDSEYSELKRAADQLQLKLSQKESECKQLQKDLNDYRGAQRINSSVTKIQGPLYELLESINRIAPPQSHRYNINEKQTQKSWLSKIPQKIILLIVLVLLLLLVVRSFSTGARNDSSDNSQMKEEIENLKRENDNYKKTCQDSKKKLDNIMSCINIEVISPEDDSPEYTASLKCDFKKVDVSWIPTPGIQPKKGDKEPELKFTLTDKNNKSTLKCNINGETKEAIVPTK